MVEAGLLALTHRRVPAMIFRYALTGYVTEGSVRGDLAGLHLPTPSFHPKIPIPLNFESGFRCGSV